jgi:16S rRNA processing protein RimM
MESKGTSESAKAGQSATPSTPEQDWMLVGVVAGPVGLRGEVKVNLTTDFPDRFQRLSTIYAGDDRRPMRIASSRRHAGRVALHFEDVPNRNAAESLRGVPLYIPRSEAMPLPEGHYYLDQIVGLRVVSIAGDTLGVIEDILHTGNNDVYVTRDGEREILIPAIHDVVRKIDLEAGTLTVEVIEGLL